MNRVLEAQNITLLKMGTFSKTEIKFSKKLTIRYKTDSGSFTYKCKAYKYEFPFLYIKGKTDSTIFDIRKIEHLNCNSKFIVLNYIGALLTTDLSVLFLLQGIKSSVPIFYFISSTSLFSTYLLIKGTKTRLDTKNKWSFVNPIESK